MEADIGERQQADEDRDLDVAAVLGGDHLAQHYGEEDREEGGVDHAARLVVGRDVDGHDIGLGHAGIALDDRLVAGASDRTGGDVGVVHHDAHAEGGAQPRHARADAAEAEDQHAAAAQLEGAGLALHPPQALAHPGGYRHDVARQAQHQHQRMLGHRGGIGLGRDHQRNAAPGQRRHVDQVVADAMAADHTQPPGLGQQRVVDHGAANDQAVGLGQAVDEGGIGRRARMFEGDAGRRGEALDALLMDGIGNDDMHGKAFEKNYAVGSL